MCTNYGWEPPRPKLAGMTTLPAALLLVQLMIHRLLYETSQRHVNVRSQYDILTQSTDHWLQLCCLVLHPIYHQHRHLQHIVHNAVISEDEERKYGTEWHFCRVYVLEIFMWMHQGCRGYEISHPYPLCECCLRGVIKHNIHGCVYLVAWWRFGAVGSDVGQINEVTLRRARLVLGWVTVSGVQLLVREIYLSLTSHPGQLINTAMPTFVFWCDFMVRLFRKTITQDI